MVSRMHDHPSNRRLATGMVLFGAAVAVAIAFAMLPAGRDRATVVDATSTSAAAIGAWAIFAAVRWELTRRSDRLFAIGLSMLAITSVAFLAHDVAHGQPFVPSTVDL